MIVSSQQATTVFPHAIPSSPGELAWLTAYTKARHEKKVADLLQQRGIDCYLPLYDSLHQWKDRRVRVSLPLFPNYVFVRIPLRERLRVLTLAGVVRLVAFNGEPACVSDPEMETLKNLLTERNAEPFAFLSSGRQVRFIHGPLQGLKGVIVRRRGRLRAVVSIDWIMRSVIVDVEASDLAPSDS